MIPAFLVVWLVLYVVFSSPSMSPLCRDGWASSSIGRQGACSSHGGIDRTLDFPTETIITGILAALIVVTSVGLRLYLKERQLAKLHAKVEAIAMRIFENPVVLKKVFRCESFLVQEGSWWRFTEKSVMGWIVTNSWLCDSVSVPDDDAVRPDLSVSRPRQSETWRWNETTKNYACHQKYALNEHTKAHDTHRVRKRRRRVSRRR